MRTLLSALVPAVCFACGPASTQSGGDASPPDASNLDASNPDASSSDAAVGSGATAHFGYVSVFYDKLQGGYAGGVSVEFETTTDPLCSERTVGACDVIRCDETSPNFTHLSAGTVTISGGTPTVNVTPLQDGSYSSSDLPAFSAGDKVNVSAAGDVLPAFSTSVTFGAPITVTTPAIGSQPIIDHMAALPLAWSGGGTGSVVASITENVSNLAVRVRCVFDAAAGSATVPAAALSDLQPASNLGTTNGGEGDLSIDSVGLTKLAPGGFPTTVSAGSVGYSGLPVIK